MTMNIKILDLALVLLCTSASSFASDEVKVEILRFSGGGCDGATTTLYFDSGAPINLTVGACDKRIDIWVPNQPFTYDIGPVTLNGNGGLFLELFIGAGSFPYGGGNMTPAARNLAGISIVEDALRANTRFAGRIYGNLTSSVRVGELYRFDVDGQIRAQVRANEAGPALFDIHMGSSTSGGVILCDTGPMAGVVSQGNVLGRIEATTGGISSIEVLNSADLLADVIAGGSITAIEVAGDIGTSGDPIAIEAADGIRKIVGWSTPTSTRETAARTMRSGTWRQPAETSPGRSNAATSTAPRPRPALTSPAI
jgi:hypothetical protein